MILTYVTAGEPANPWWAGVYNAGICVMQGPSVSLFDFFANIRAVCPGYIEQITLLSVDPKWMFERLCTGNQLPWKLSEIPEGFRVLSME